MNFANALIDVGRGDDALRAYDNALALLAEEPERGTEALIRMNRALLLHDLGRRREELDEWNRAVRLLGPADQDYRHLALLHRARVQLELGDRKRARADLDDALLLSDVSAGDEDRSLAAELSARLGRDDSSIRRSG